MTKKEIYQEALAKHLVKESTYLLSLSSIIGKKIVDVQGYISQQFGDDTPVFNVCNITLSDGTKLSVEGEHDIAYVPYDDLIPGITEADMNNLVDPCDDDDQ